MGTKPVGRLLTQYALPAIIAMTASSLYNMVDSIFIGQGVGALAISGLAVTFPFMNLSAAFGAGVGVGSSSYLSVKLGQKDYSTAQRILGNNVTLNIIIGLVFSVVSLLFLDPILYFFGASEQTIPYAREYMVIILLGNIITHLYFGMNAVLRAASKPRQAMYTTIFTVVLNSVLDPLFIYTFDMGIRGAAFATILSQTVALVWQTSLFSDKSELLHLRRGIYRLDNSIVKNILGIGISPFAMNATACLVAIFVNQRLLEYGGDLAVGAYGIANRVAFIFVMITMGVNQGMQPIAGYNFGAREYSRVKQVFWLTVICASAVSFLGFIVSECCPDIAVSLFTNDPELMALADKGLRMMNIALPLVGFQMVTTNFFQSLGMVHKSIFLSLSRQLLFLVPLIYFLPVFFGHKGVWMSFPIADTISIILSAVMLLMLFRKFRLLNDGDDPSILGSKIKQA